MPNNHSAKAALMKRLRGRIEADRHHQDDPTQPLSRQDQNDVSRAWSGVDGRASRHDGPEHVIGGEHVTDLHTGEDVPSKRSRPATRIEKWDETQDFD